jgi:hypothetical protein
LDRVFKLGLIAGTGGDSCLDPGSHISGELVIRHVDTVLVANVDIREASFTYKGFESATSKGITAGPLSQQIMSV